MDSVHGKVVLLTLIIASSVIDFTLHSPIFKHKTNEQKLQHAFVAALRLRRQIVQPKWLNNGHETSIDPTVKVNPQSLSEAAEIRKTIQKAVEEGTFVVPDEEQVENDGRPAFSTTLAPTDMHPTHTVNSLPNWYIRMEKFWHNLRQRFHGFRSRQRAQPIT